MRDSTRIPAGATIRLGPGTFETHGNNIITGWFARNGKIIGSGIFITTLKLVSASTVNTGYVIVATNVVLDFFEISDLTLDCNLAGQAVSSGYTYARICVNGLDLVGSNITVRRVRVINWGTQTPIWEFDTGFSSLSFECFPIFVGSFSELTNNVIEDCICDQPGGWPARETTCISLGGGEPAATGAMGHHLSGVIRNCLVNGQRNGRSNVRIAVTAVSCSTGLGPYLATIEFGEDHHLSAGDHFVVSNVGVATSSAGTTFDYFSAYNGYFQIVSVPSSNQLTYVPKAQPNPNNYPVDIYAALMGTITQAYAAPAADNCVVERNRALGVQHCVYHDTWPNKSFIVRDNYFRDIYKGVYQLFGGNDTALVTANRSGTVQKETGTGYNVRFNMTSGSHYLSLGDVVRIIDGSEPSFQGKFEVTAIISSSAFGWTMSPLPSPWPSGTYHFNRVYSLKFLKVENNIIDLMLHPAANVNGPPPIAIAIEHDYGQGSTNPWLFKQLIVRGNIIRHTDGASDPNWAMNSEGVQIMAAENAIIENNLIDLETTLSSAPTTSHINVSECKTVKVFNNRDVKGALSNPYNWDGYFIRGLEDDADNAILGLLYP